MRLRGFGRTFQRGAVWWIAFYHRGEEYRESVPKTLGRPASEVTEQDAKNLLKARLSAIQAGRFIGPEQDRLTVAALLDGYLANLRLRGKKSIKPAESICRQLVATFGEHTRAVDLTAEQIAAAMQRWLAARTRGTVAHRAARLRAALSLAHRQGRILQVPYIPPLEVHNARRGFFEQAEFDRVYGFLREPINDLVQFAFLSGWRKAEILGLTWPDIDRAAGVVRLRDSKSGEGRAVPLYWTDDAGARHPLAFATLIEKRWKAKAETAWVFHRRGKPVRDFRDAWAEACTRAGVAGRVFHDFRRTSYRNMLDAGVDPLTAMTVVGHKTLSMAKRYAIHDVRQLGRALAKTEAHLAARRAMDADKSRTMSPEVVA